MINLLMDHRYTLFTAQVPWIIGILYLQLRYRGSQVYLIYSSGTVDHRYTLFTAQVPLFIGILYLQLTMDHRYTLFIAQVPRIVGILYLQLRHQVSQVYFIYSLDTMNHRYTLFTAYHGLSMYEYPTYLTAYVSKAMMKTLV